MKIRTSEPDTSLPSARSINSKDWRPIWFCLPGTCLDCNI